MKKVKAWEVPIVVFLCGEVEAALEVFWRVLAPVNFAIVKCDCPRMWDEESR